MKSFMTAKEAITTSNNNRNKKIAYYYYEISKDRIVKKIERAITKTVLNGEMSCRVVCWKKPSDRRDEAIKTYFSNLGYNIDSSNGIYYIRFQPRR